MKKVDFIIAGLGLAGAAVAHQLIARKKTIAVFDTPEENRSSSVAAGLLNPVTGKMMNKAWKADMLFPYLHQFYLKAEQITGNKFYYESPLFIPFLSIGEQNDWMLKTEDPSMRGYIREVFSRVQYGMVKNEFGGVLLQKSGYLDTSVYLQSTRSMLIDSNAYLNQKLIAEELSFNGDTVRYRDFEAAAIIFCEGMHSLNNVLFKWLPILPLKGETIDISLDEPPPGILNRGVYLVPGGAGAFRVGATYERNAMEGISEAGKAELIQKLEALIKVPYRVLGQSWGIRPTTHDRRPVLGRHPMHTNVLVFNGMGTKGVSQAPYFSGVLADHLSGKDQIERDVNITRYYALYSMFRDDLCVG